MYNRIKNPNTNRYVNINSNLGINILKNYINYSLGGTDITEPYTISKSNPNDMNTLVFCHGNNRPNEEDVYIGGPQDHPLLQVFLNLVKEMSKTNIKYSTLDNEESAKADIKRSIIGFSVNKFNTKKVSNYIYMNCDRKAVIESYYQIINSSLNRGRITVITNLLTIFFDILSLHLGDNTTLLSNFQQIFDMVKTKYTFENNGVKFLKVESKDTTNIFIKTVRELFRPKKNFFFPIMDELHQKYPGLEKKTFIDSINFSSMMLLRKIKYITYIPELRYNIKAEHIPGGVGQMIYQEKFGIISQFPN